MVAVRGVVNRVLLGVVGLILLAVGGAVLVGGLDLPRRLGFTLPSWWPYAGRHDVLLGAHARTRYRGQGWWWPMVIGVLALLVAVALWWLLSQLHDRRLGQVVVDSGDDGRALVRGRALEQAIAADAEFLDGVGRAGVLLTRRRAAPAALMQVVLEAGAAPQAVVRGLDERVLDAARRSAGLAALPAEVRLRAERHRARRVE
ncbi:alkaline shock response membrane anchor protein AmaP [Streptomyces sp. RB6PN25]|uniref:Alkaline shock response membrane anchor protein AmaP n=1 Tax=Streptomyces humicola TaxID=2953240 RepID=A0ABT1Q0F7_9ACTN|nr:alkaline shock response membrane anchor protein AmaP [Streptomyces humicola]MCQ4083389.1 alkaline shock response membrane anchor protein AmaP [Streptomyces humicola]